LNKKVENSVKRNLFVLLDLRRKILRGYNFFVIRSKIALPIIRSPRENEYERSFHYFFNRKTDNESPQKWY